MSVEDEDIAARAAEYVLGTLPADERLLFAQRLERESDLRDLVGFWEDRLAPLAADVPSVRPPGHLWTAISRALDPIGRALPASVIQLDRLRRSRAAWRSIAIGTTAMAAGLLLWIAVVRPPDPQAARELVAAVNRSGDLPALIVRVDPRTGAVKVRTLGAETPPGRSLELWSVVGGETRSLGTLDPAGTRIPVAPQDRGRLADALLAVSVEPVGGSPTGVATGPIVYTGKLVPEPE